MSGDRPDPGLREHSFYRRAAPRAAEGEGALAPGAAHTRGQRIAHFVLRRFIAQGGMGQVWEAWDEDLRRAVALKLVLPERIDERSLALFAREAHAGGRLAHPSIVTTLAHGTEAGRAWIAQELVDGSWTLKDFLDEVRAADSVPKGYYPRTAELVAQLADALQAAHDAGVIHRDVKPQNILIAPDETPKLADFGLARVSDDSFLSISGEFAGTYAYMSPEQVTAGRMGLDHRTDIFSLGIVLYELLSLRRPFEGDTTHQIAEKIISFDPPEPSRIRSQCPRELSIICVKAIAKGPGQRYQTMAELAADLRRHLANEPIEARPPGPLTRAVKWSRRNPAVSSSGAVALLALAVVSSLLVVQARTAAELGRSNVELAAQTALTQRNADLAEASAQDAHVARRDAEQRSADVLSLSAQKDLDDLLAEAQELWPAHPDMLPRYERWLARARLLVDGRPADPARGVKARPSLAEHRAKLAALRARAELEQDLPVFEDAEDAWWYRQLAGLVSGIEALFDPTHGLAGDTVAAPFGWGIARRLAFAERIVERSIDGEAARRLWGQAVLGVATSPRYGGLELAPQLGLLPLGPDPDSGLWEFAHLQTGEPPQYGPDGELVPHEGMGIVLVLMPGGTFWMGAERDPDGPNYDPYAAAEEGPVHQVELSPYFLSKYALTQAQWLRIAGRNPSGYQPPHPHVRDLTHPVEQISWPEGKAMLERLGLVYPSEAQWEHAARGGTRTPWWTGAERESLRGKVNLADQSAQRGGANWSDIDDWPDLDDGWTVHAPVGTFAANPFGLHEVVGNVWEWCLDGFQLDAYRGPRGKDPVVPWEGAENLASRGGAFSFRAAGARSASRGPGTPDLRGAILGLRPARRIDEPQPTSLAPR